MVSLLDNFSSSWLLPVIGVFHLIRPPLFYQVVLSVPRPMLLSCLQLPRDDALLPGRPADVAYQGLGLRSRLFPALVIFLQFPRARCALLATLTPAQDDFPPYFPETPRTGYFSAASCIVPD